MRNFLLKPTDSLRLAMERVSKNGEGFAAVVDEKRKWLGTFHDSDGRLAMLRGVSLDDPVPFKKSAKDHFVIADGVVKDVVQFDRPKFDAVVMAGGKGTRLRAVTGTVPKPLLNLGRSTIVERIIGRLREADADEVWLSVNYRAGEFKKRLKDSVRYIEENAPLGTAGALSLLPKKGAHYVLVSNADLITSVDYRAMFDYHRAHDGPVTMAAAIVTSQVKFGVVHTKRNGVLDRMEEKPVVDYLCNAGMYVLDRWVLELIPKNKFFLMTDLLDAVRSRGSDVHVFPMWEKWVDAGSPEEFQQVLIEFATGVVE